MKWTLEDWMCVIWTDETTFETGLNSYTCYVTCRLDTVMDYQYQKPTFKNKQITLGIQGTIILGRKGLMHFLVKDGQMTLEIYVNQVFQLLNLPFFKEMMEENEFMIWMDDSAVYYTSKFTTKFCYKVDLLRIKWPA